MFIGSEIASEVMNTQLQGIPALVSVVGDRLTNSPFIPNDMPFPACYFYPVDASYAGPMGKRPRGQIAFELVAMSFSLVCEGESTEPIRAAHLAQLLALDGKGFDYTDDAGAHYRVVFTAEGEVLPTRLMEAKQPFRRLGTLYSVEITRG
ncbi:MAG: hypothetical protein WBA46_17160 [Thermomicrobiales bacterium]